MLFFTRVQIKCSFIILIVPTHFMGRGMKSFLDWNRQNGFETTRVHSGCCLHHLAEYIIYSNIDISGKTVMSYSRVNWIPEQLTVIRDHATTGRVAIFKRNTSKCFMNLGRRIPTDLLQLESSVSFLPPTQAATHHIGTLLMTYEQ